MAGPPARHPAGSRPAPPATCRHGTRASAVSRPGASAKAVCFAYGRGDAGGLWSAAQPARGILVPKKLPLNPRHPERICWGCDKYCAADDLRCGNGTDRTQHPVEIFGEEWLGSEPAMELVAGDGGPGGSER